MTNRSSSKQHGRVGNIRPVSTEGKRRNKAKAAARREKRQEEQRKRIKAAEEAIR